MYSRVAQFTFKYAHSHWLGDPYLQTVVLAIYLIKTKDFYVVQRESLLSSLFALRVQEHIFLSEYLIGCLCMSQPLQIFRGRSCASESWRKCLLTVLISNQLVYNISYPI